LIAPQTAALVLENEEPMADAKENGGKSHESTKENVNSTKCPQVDSPFLG